MAKIELFMKNVPVIGELSGIAHSFLILTEEDGSRFILRGGPEASPRINAPLGQLIIESGPYTEKSKDWGDYSGVTIYENEDAPQKFLAAQLLAKDINTGKYPYTFDNQNCNTVAFLAIEVMGLSEKVMAMRPLYECGKTGDALCQPPGFGYNDLSFPYGSVSVYYYQELAKEQSLSKDGVDTLSLSEKVAPEKTVSSEHPLNSEMDTFLKSYNIDPASLPHQAKVLLAKQLITMSMHQQRAAILADQHQRDLNRGKQIMAEYQGVRDAASALAQIGQGIGHSGLYKAGVFVQALTDVKQNVALLAGAIPGIAAPVGLAALTPISAIVLAAFSVFSLFRKKRRQGNPLQPIMQQLQVISQQIQVLHRDMLLNFEQVFINQQYLLDTLVKGVQLLSELIDRRIDDAVLPIMYSVAHIADDLNHAYRTLFQQSHAVSLHSLEEKIHKTNAILADEVEMLQARKIEKLTDTALDLELWLHERAGSKIYNGVVCYNPAAPLFSQTRQTNQAATLTVMSQDNHQDLTFLLGYLAHQLGDLLGDKFPAHIDKNKLINPKIWLSIIDTYLKIREYLYEQGIKYDSKARKLAEIRSMAENAISLIQFVQTSPDLYTGLLDKYIVLLAQIRQAINSTIVINSFKDIDKSIRHKLAKYNFEIDEAKFKSISQDFQQKIKPYYDHYAAQLEKRKQEKFDLLTQEMVWLGKIISNKDAFIEAVRVLHDVSQKADNVLAAEIGQFLTVPLNTFAQMEEGQPNGYRIPIDFSTLLNQLNIPRLYLLAERLGILTFEMTYKWHSNPNAWHAGMRMPNDEYKYTVTVNIIVEDHQVTLGTFDCVGSLLNNSETKDIPALHNAIYPYWFSNYNVHYGDGRYAPNGVGLAMAPIMYAVGIVGPLLGNSLRITSKTNLNFSQAELPNAVAEKTNRWIDRVYAQASTRLQGVPNSDWTNLQPIFEQAQEISFFMGAFMQLAGFDAKMLERLNVLDRKTIENYLTMQVLPESLRKELAASKKEVETDLIPDLEQTIQTLKRDVLQALAQSESSYCFTSEIEQNLQFWISYIEMLEVTHQLVILEPTNTIESVESAEANIECEDGICHNNKLGDKQTLPAKLYEVDEVDQQTSVVTSASARLEPPFTSLLSIIANIPATVSSYLIDNMPQLTVDKSNSSSAIVQSPKRFSDETGYSYDKFEVSQTIDPLSGQPIYDYRFWYKNQEIANAKTYAHPIPCVGERELRSNILEATGVLAGVENFPFEDTCAILPPTYTQIGYDGAKEGAQLGIMRGIAAVVGDGLLQRGYSQTKAHIIQQGVFYGSYFALRLYEIQQENSEQNPSNVIWRAGTETAGLAITNIALTGTNQLLRYTGNKLQQAGWSLSGKIAEKTAGVVHYAGYAYKSITACIISPMPARTAKEVVTRVASSIGIGYLAETATKKMASVLSYFGLLKSKQPARNNTAVVNTKNYLPGLRGPSS